MNLVVDIVKYLPDGSILPCCLFHRPYDLLHSRCIEYPFAASHLKSGERILDIGTANGDSLWVNCLTNVETEVHCIDVDDLGPTKSLHFSQQDARKMNFPDNYFDKVFAISVIEHIGLEKCQSKDSNRPEIDENGDLRAIQEISRVLKPGGKLILTIPFGKRRGLMNGDDARCYDKTILPQFDEIFNLVDIQYYEYQDRARGRYRSIPGAKRKKSIGLLLWEIWIYRWTRNWLSKIKSKLLRRSETKFPNIDDLVPAPFTEFRQLGSVTWRRVNPDRAAAENAVHCDGVLCAALTPK